jgi:hypothetical protein
MPPEEARTAQNATMPYNDAERVDALKATGVWRVDDAVNTTNRLLNRSHDSIRCDDCG